MSSRCSLEVLITHSELGQLDAGYPALRVESAIVVVFDGRRRKSILLSEPTEDRDFCAIK